MKHFYILTAVLLFVSITLKADDWMSRLADNTAITQLSIPGTHDTGTGNGFTSEWAEKAKTFAQTQDCSLAEQWERGVRAFDLRPALISDEEGTHLHIYHGLMKTQLSYEKALLQLCRFLDEHPSEFVFVVQRHETDGDGGNKGWNAAMDNFLHTDPVKGHIINYSSSLTVGDVRGKIIFLSRVRYAEQPVGAFIDNWTSDEDFIEQSSAVIFSANGKAPLYVQDYYDTCGENMKVKLQCIKNMLYAPKTDGALVINHCSGYSDIVTIDGNEYASSDGYRDNATVTNNAMIGMLKTYNGCTGLVMMDYAGVNKSGHFRVSGKKLIKAIIKQNFKRKD